MGKADSGGELKLAAWSENGRQRSSFPGARSRRHSSKSVPTPTLTTQESQVCLGSSDPSGVQGKTKNHFPGIKVAI